MESHLNLEKFAYVLVARPVERSDWNSRCRAAVQRGSGQSPAGTGDGVLLSGGPLPVVPAAASETLERRASVEQRKRRILQGNFVVTILFLLTAYSRKYINSQIKP